MKKIDTRYVVAGLIGVGILFFGVSSYVHTKQAEYVSMMKVLIAQQETTLISIAEVTDRNGADAVVAGIIEDCDADERLAFDDLLGRLGSLHRLELVEVDQLFSACGNFYAQRKALMIARLDREYQVYADYVALLNVVDSKAQDISYPTQKWSDLVGMELQRSELSSQLVVIQENIIDGLRAGASVQSEELHTEVTNAQEAKDTLSYLGVKIDTLREDIIGL